MARRSLEALTLARAARAGASDTRDTVRRKRRDAERRLPRQPTGMGIERSYLADINRAALVPLFALIDRMLIQQLPALQVIAAATFDAVTVTRADISDDVGRIMASIEAQYNEEISDIALENLAERRALELTNVNRRGLQRQFRRAVGLDTFAEDPKLQGSVKAFSNQNARMIKLLAVRHRANVEQLTTNGFRSGLRIGTIAKQLRAQTGVTRRHAKLIARDQISKLNGQLTRRRQVNNGITKFKWITVGDERVRDEHEAINGQTFTWEAGHPTEGFPGQPINCRCVAEPVFDFGAASEP